MMLVGQLIVNCWVECVDSFMVRTGESMRDQPLISQTVDDT